MPARDILHDFVKEALNKDGWVITHDPFVVAFKALFLDISGQVLIEDYQIKLIVVDAVRKEIIAFPAGDEAVVLARAVPLHRAAYTVGLGQQATTSGAEARHVRLTFLLLCAPQKADAAALTIFDLVLPLRPRHGPAPPCCHVRRARLTRFSATLYRHQYSPEWDGGTSQGQGDTRRSDQKMSANLTFPTPADTIMPR